ncbi:choline transporter-like protein 5 isoform X3 [Hemicordylus capensis]|uniref:choline transporter-like protein 5 isoform X3 n=1 Tax=Hemicordylus capensis TaxID=884348 RepID=UPI0023024F35|nr:choline transporter-like protein 5 isoform X3 [Hemicordylus capensis]
MGRPARLVATAVAAAAASSELPPVFTCCSSSALHVAFAALLGAQEGPRRGSLLGAAEAGAEAAEKKKQPSGWLLPPPPPPPQSCSPARLPASHAITATKSTLSSGRRGARAPSSASPKDGERTMARKGDASASPYGQPRKFDPKFRGPIHNRHCTDVFCCVIFVVVILGYIALGIVVQKCGQILDICTGKAWVHGDPRKVAYPTDSYGQFCGQKNTPNENKTILFYFNILKCASPLVLINLQCPTTQLCVSKCPDRFATYIDMQSSYRYNSYWEYYRQFCKPGFNKPRKSVAQVMRDEDCPSMIIPSRPFLKRCFPDFSTKNGVLTVANQTTFKDGRGKTRNVTDLREAANGINNVLDARSVGMKIFEDYASSWYWILIGLFIAMVVSLLFLVLLRFTAGVLFWIFIFGVIGIIGYGIWHCYWEFHRLHGIPGSDLTIYDIGFQTDFRVYLQLRQTWLAFMILLCIVEVVIILMLIFLRNRIRIAIALLKEGSRAIGYIMSTLFYPIITFILIAICISYWAVTAVFLATSGEPVYKVMANQSLCKYANLTCYPETFNTTNVTKLCPGAQCTFAFYGGESLYHRYIFVFQICNVFVFLWLVNFAIALGQCTLAGAFASYYWAFRKPADIPACPLFSSFGRAIRYHTGSLAFGSLILAVVQVIRVILEYLDHKLKGSQNAFARFLLCCLKCCFWCLEKFLKFINRNAYIMIAIYGKNFCTSAKEAFFLLMRNVVRVAVLDKVTDFLLFLGKILVAGGVGVLAFFFFTHRIPVFTQEAPSLNYYWVPLLTVIIGSYLVAHGFFSVYAMCVDTLFLCFCEDLERNDGSTAKPYYMSASLHRILGKKELSPKKLMG